MIVAKVFIYNDDGPDEDENDSVDANKWWRRGRSIGVTKRTMKSSEEMLKMLRTTHRKQRLPWVIIPERRLLPLDRRYCT